MQRARTRRRARRARRRRCARRAGPSSSGPLAMKPCAPSARPGSMKWQGPTMICIRSRKRSIRCEWWKKSRLASLMPTTGATPRIASMSSSVRSMPLRRGELYRTIGVSTPRAIASKRRSELVARRLQHVGLRQHEQAVGAGVDDRLRVADRLRGRRRGHAGDDRHAARRALDREPREARAFVEVEVPALAVVAGDADRARAQPDQPVDERAELALEDARRRARTA